MKYLIVRYDALANTLTYTATNDYSKVDHLLKHYPQTTVVDTENNNILTLDLQPIQIPQEK